MCDISTRQARQNGDAWASSSRSVNRSNVAAKSRDQLMAEMAEVVRGPHQR